MNTLLTATTAHSTAAFFFLALTALIFSSGCGMMGSGSAFDGYWQGPATYDYKTDGDKYSNKSKHAVVEISTTEDGLAIIIENFGGDNFNCTLFAEIDGDKFDIDRDYCQEWEGNSLFMQGEGELRGDDELDLDIEFEFENSGIIYASGQVSFSLDKM